MTLRLASQRRTRSWDYSEFNLAAFMDLATLGAHVGIDLWHHRTADGRSIRQGLDFMVPYAAGERKWTFDQITTFRASTITGSCAGAVAWKEPKYMALAEKIAGGCSNREIGVALGIAQATVKWHVNIILSRLDVGDRTQAIVTALQRGILHLP
jgi:DNA-binding CsgD family transcriptional regulator